MNSIKVVALALLVFAWSTLPIVAQSKTALQCADRILQSQVDRCVNIYGDDAPTIGGYASCMFDADKIVGKRLSGVYGQRIRESGRALASRLRKTQRMWLKWQKKLCDYEGDIGSTWSPTSRYSYKAFCLVRTTAVRFCELSVHRGMPH